MDGTRVALAAADARRSSKPRKAATIASATCFACWTASGRTTPTLIAERFPKLNRCVTGYDLVHLCDCHGRFDLSAVICGAEGTLAFVTEAKIKLTPMPRFTALLNIRYASFDAALRDAGTLMKLEAASSETIDATVLALRAAGRDLAEGARVLSRRRRRARRKA